MFRKMGNIYRFRIVEDTDKNWITEALQGETTGLLSVEDILKGGRILNAHEGLQDKFYVGPFYRIISRQDGVGGDIALATTLIKEAGTREFQIFAIHPTHRNTENLGEEIAKAMHIWGASPSCPWKAVEAIIPIHKPLDGLKRPQYLKVSDDDTTNHYYINRETDPENTQKPF